MVIIQLCPLPCFLMAYLPSSYVYKPCFWYNNTIPIENQAGAAGGVSGAYYDTITMTPLIFFTRSVSQQIFRRDIQRFTYGHHYTKRSGSNITLSTFKPLILPQMYLRRVCGLFEVYPGLWTFWKVRFNPWLNTTAVSAMLRVLLPQSRIGQRRSATRAAMRILRSDKRRRIAAFVCLWCYIVTLENQSNKLRGFGGRPPTTSSAGFLVDTHPP